MKKIYAFLLAGIMVFSLAACGGGDDDKIQISLQQTQSASPSNSQPSGEEKSPAKKAEKIAAGFGSYNGKPIVWRVLTVDVQNEKALLITKDLLDEIKFHEEEEPENLTWETSDLRAWLGGEFYDTAFTDEQKVKILEVVNPADTNSESGAQGGNDTTDKVFILSASEMQKYFTDDEDMAGTLNGENFSYWTRTPGNDTTGYVCIYSGYGGLYMTGNQAESPEVAVRPAIWVDLSD